MLETSARLLRLLALLQMRRDWSGHDLADRLDVDLRTVRRDVERLRALGYPVHAAPGVGGGYRLEAGTDLPPLLLDDDEAVAVAVGLQVAPTGPIAGIEETALRALAKLEQVLPARLRGTVNALRAAIVSVPPDVRGPTVEAGTLSAVAAACRDHERLRFDYVSHDGQGSSRLVEPHRLVSWGRRWYLLAWDVERSDWRTYRVDRLQPRVSGPRFVPREPPEDPAAYVSRGVSAAAWRYQARVKVHAPAAVIAERITAAVGIVEAVDDNSCILATGADSVDTVVVWLGMLGADFEVTDPGPPGGGAHVGAHRVDRGGHWGKRRRHRGHGNMEHAVGHVCRAVDQGGRPAGVRGHCRRQVVIANDAAWPEAGAADQVPGGTEAKAWPVVAQDLPVRSRPCRCRHRGPDRPSAPRSLFGYSCSSHHLRPRHAGPQGRPRTPRNWLPGQRWPRRSSRTPASPGTW